MPYVYIEDQEVISVLEYQAETPDGVESVEITDNEYHQLFEGTHIFDIEKKKVFENPNQIEESKDAELREFLNSTDWKVLRHIRETNLGLETSLSQDEYTALEKERQNAAKQIGL